MLPCIVLGGGLGSRLGEETEHIPKPLVSVAGTPFVTRQLRWLRSQGIEEIVYSVGHLGHLIQEEVALHDDLREAVRFVDEGEQLLGTGGAIRLAIDQGALDATFFVLYGDSYLQIDLQSVSEAFDSRAGEALMTVYANDGAWDTSNVVFDGCRVSRYDKSVPDPARAGMRHIDYGLSILQASTILRLIPARKPFDLGDVLRQLSEQSQLLGFEADVRFYEIGSPGGLAELRKHLQDQKP